MSSTDVETVFAQEIVPRAKPHFALHADRGGRESYFVARTSRVMSRDDFARPVVRSPEELTERLTAWWTSHGTPELAPLATALGALAASVREPVVDEAPGDVSSLVYPMF